jgi:type IV secretory pathway TrbL component
MPQRTLKSRLGQLALALLNATLLLAVLLVFGLWLLIGRVQGFTADTARAAAAAMGEELGAPLGERAASLAATLDSLATLDTRIGAAIAGAGSADSKAVAELGALRSDVQGLTAAVGALNTTATGLRDLPVTAVSDTLHQILLDLAARLGPSSPPTPPAN